MSTEFVNSCLANKGSSVISGFSHDDRTRDPINRTVPNMLDETFITYITCRRPPMLPNGSLSNNSSRSIKYLDTYPEILSNIRISETSY